MHLRSVHETSARLISISKRAARSPVAALPLAIALCFALAGCQPAKPTPPAQRTLTIQRPHVAPNVNTDPCAMRLHDLCEPLLLYYMNHQSLPAKLEQLREVPRFGDLELSCPVSGQRYVYNQVGLKAPDGRGRIVIHDPTSAHDGVRWGISIVEDGTGPLITKVIAVPAASLVQPMEPGESRQ